MSDAKTTNRRRVIRYEFQIDNRRSGMSKPEWMPVIGRDHIATLEDCEAMAKRATDGNWPPHRIVPHESDDLQHKEKVMAAFWPIDTLSEAEAICASGHSVYVELNPSRSCLEACSPKEFFGWLSRDGRNDVVEIIRHGRLLKAVKTS